MFSHVAEHARLYRALVGDGGSGRVINHMHRRLTIAIHVNLGSAESARRGHADDPSQVPHDPEAAFLAGALVGVILEWLRRGCPGTAQQMSVRIWPLLTGAASAAEFLPVPDDGHRKPQAS